MAAGHTGRIEGDQGLRCTAEDVLSFGQGGAAAFPDQPAARSPCRPAGISSSAEGVAGAMDRADEARIVRAVANGGADLRHEYREVAIGDRCVRPERLEHLPLAEGAWARLDEKPEQVEGLRREVDRFLPAKQATAIGIEPQPTEFDSHKCWLRTRS